MTGFYQKLLHKGYTLIENLLFKRFSFFTKKDTLLLIRLDSIGDYVLFRNFIQALKTSQKYKNHSITLCGNSWWKELSENLDLAFIDRFIWVDYAKLPERAYRYQFHKKIFLAGFETVINPAYSRDVYSDELVKYSGGRNKIGYDGDTINISEKVKNDNNKFYTILLTSHDQHCFEYYRNKDFFESLIGRPLLQIKPIINNDKPEKNHIIFFPGAKDAFRRWSSQNFAGLGNALNSLYPQLQIIVCGSPADSTFAAEIVNTSTAKIQDATGKYSLVELLDVIATAKLIVANDSGPFHIAVALNKNVVCISNGNNYGRFTPYPKEMKTNSIVLYPPEILKYKEEERLQKFHKMVRDVDINEIMVEEVFSSITKNFKISES